MDELDDLPPVRSTGEAGVSASLEEATLATRAGDYEAALAAYDRALDADPAHLDALLGRAAAARALGRPREALRSCLTALESAPRHVGARVELAAALRAAGRHDEAQAIHAVLVRDAADSAEAWSALGRLLAEDGRAAAEACLRRAVALDPAHVGARFELARWLYARGRHAQAVDAFHDVVALAPDDAAAHAGLAEALVAMRRLDEAEERLDRALGLDDENVEARLARARLRLLKGDLPGAWADRDYRWHRPGVSRPRLPGEPWEGRPVEGLSVLLYAEQSAADCLQFARFAPLLAERGARVWLSVQPTLVALLAGGLAGVERVVPNDRPLPPDLVPDLTASLLDLPNLLGTTLATLPPAPYLAAPADRRRAIVPPPGTLLKVGLAWAGMGGADDIAFTDLLPLSEVEGVALFGLQYGPRAADATQRAHPALVTDLSPTIAHFADTAARIAEMDVVVTVDSPIAHLAGAMGKPVLLLLSNGSDCRWMLERDDSPWYPAMRLFRQRDPGDWAGVVARVRSALAELAAEATGRRAAGLRSALGPKAAMRAFLEAHLQAGDLLVDVEAGDGSFTLDAAAHPSGEVRVLAIEPDPADADVLRDTLAIAGAEDVVEVVAAAVGDRAGSALVSKAPRCGGRRVFALPDWVPGRHPVVALDQVLGERPDLEGRRLVLRLGQAGWEAEILDGLWEWLALGRIAVAVWEHRDGSPAAEMAANSGYSLWRFPSEVAAGRPVAFAGEEGPVLALAPGVDPAASYGEALGGDLPGDVEAARAEAGRLTAEAVALHRAGQLGEAAKLYGRALMRDPAAVDANANLAVLLRMGGRLEASVACCRRALARRDLPAVSSNLGNALRELGRLAEAEAALMAAAAAEPDNPDILYNLALLRRDQDRDREAVALLERVRARRTAAPAITWQIAEAHLKAGDVARGFAEAAGRRRAAPPAECPDWEGDDPAGRTILVKDEEAAADSVLLARFIPLLARRGALVTVQCRPELVRLMAELPGVEQAVPLGETAPACDLSTGLLDLPRLLGTTASTIPHAGPYLHLPEGLGPRPVPAGPRLLVGLSWAGPAGRLCPLPEVLALAADPGVQLVSLQQGDHAADLARTGARAFIDDWGSRAADLAELAAIIQGLDLVIAGDTAAAHLAGALGKRVWVLLPRHADWKWPDGREDSPWYPTMRVFHQAPDGAWQPPLERMARALSALAAGKR